MSEDLERQEFFDLAERFRNATDPKEVERLGDQMGQLVFGKLIPKAETLPRGIHQPG